jgi:hypothetical protein
MVTYDMEGLLSVYVLYTEHTPEGALPGVVKPGE